MGLHNDPGLAAPHGATRAMFRHFAAALHANERARRQYRQQVLGIRDVRQATPEQLALARKHDALPVTHHANISGIAGTGTFDTPPDAANPGGVPAGPAQTAPGTATPGLMSAPASLAALVNAAASANVTGLKGGPAGGRPTMQGSGQFAGAMTPLAALATRPRSRRTRRGPAGITRVTIPSNVGI